MNLVEPTTLTTTDIKTQASFIRRATTEIINETEHWYQRVMT